jgi:hypothetical protein
MDEAECAEKYEQDERDRILAKAHAAAIVEIPLEYVCRECGEETSGGRWCSQSCCATWTRRLGV